MKGKEKKILAISSCGGHWIQLKRLLPSLSGHEVIFAATSPFHRDEVRPHRFYRIVDANRETFHKIVVQAFQVLSIVLQERPDIVISTGASCGFFALFLGKIFGKKTIWVDSLANAGKISFSGKIVGKFADLWLTQWPDLARPNGPYYKGAVF